MRFLVLALISVLVSGCGAGSFHVTCSSAKGQVVFEQTLLRDAFGNYIDIYGYPINLPAQGCVAKGLSK